MPDLRVYQDADGAVHIRVDRDGERAVSTVVEDVPGLIRLLAEAAGLEVQVNEPS